MYAAKVSQKKMYQSSVTQFFIAHQLQEKAKAKTNNPTKRKKRADFL